MMTDADFERMTDDEFDKWKSDPTKSLDEVEAFFLYLGRKYGKADVLYNKKNARVLPRGPCGQGLAETSEEGSRPPNRRRLAHDESGRRVDLRPLSISAAACTAQFAS